MALLSRGWTRQRNKGLIKVTEPEAVAALGSKGISLLRSQSMNLVFCPAFPAPKFTQHLEILQLSSYLFRGSQQPCQASRVDVSTLLPIDRETEAPRHGERHPRPAVVRSTARQILVSQPAAQSLPRGVWGQAPRVLDGAVSRAPAEALTGTPPEEGEEGEEEGQAGSPGQAGL